jgi:hypothetical protein
MNKQDAKEIFELFKKGLSIEDALFYHYKNREKAQQIKIEFYQELVDLQELALIERYIELRDKLSAISESRGDMRAIAYELNLIDRSKFEVEALQRGKDKILEDKIKLQRFLLEGKLYEDNK